MSTFDTASTSLQTVHLLRRRRLLLMLVALAVFTSVGTAAWAYWTSTGAGNATATTGTLNSPTAISATSTTGSGSVGLTWTASAGSLAPQGYYVTRTRSDNTPFAACGSGPASLIHDTSCTDTNVPDGTYSYVVTAVFNSWSAKSAPSGSVAVTNSVDTATTLASSANPSVVGQTVTYTATVTQASGTAKPTGSVAFAEGGQPVTCTNPDGQTLNASGAATCQVTYSGVGSHSVKAAYAGATGFNGSTSNTVAQVVSKAATSTALTSDANPSKSGQQVTYTAAVTVTSPGAGTPSGSVTFKEGTITVCAGQPVDTNGKATCSVTYPGVSSHQIVASYSGDGSFLSSDSSTLNQSVDKAATSTSLVSNANPAVTGQSVTFTATVSVTGPGAGTPTGSVTFKNGGTAITCTGGNQTLSGSGPATCVTSFGTTGTKTMTAVYAGTSDFTSSTSGDLSQAINAAVPPTTSTSLSGTPGANGWYTSSVQVTLSATAGSLAVAKTEYSLTGGAPWTTYSGPFTVSAQAITTVTFRSTDIGANVEPDKTQQIKIDTVAPNAPVITGMSNDTGSSATDGVTNQASQAVSGTAEAGATVTLKSGSTTLGMSTANSAGAWTVTGVTLNNGTNSFTATAVDNAGNASGQSGSFTAILDTVMPNSVRIVTGNQVSLTATDNVGGGGVAKIEYKIGTGSYTVYSTSFSVSSGQTVSYRATDLAGNVEQPENTFTYVDTAGPTITPTDPTPGQSYATGNNGGGSWSRVCTNGKVCATVSDPAGVATVTYKLVGTQGTNVKCWNGSGFITGSSCGPVSMSNGGSGNNWAGSQISQNQMGVFEWSLTYTATDGLGNVSTVTITFKTT